jgi:hypothetical protein
VPDANSLTISGRVLPPATGTPPPDLVVSVSVDAYDLQDHLILSGAVKSNGFGDYRVEATPTAAFGTFSGRPNAIARLVVKLSENSVAIDSTETRNRLTIGHNYPTRDLHG